jgi:hypothetical protein
MIYIGSSFLAVVGFGSTPAPSPPLPSTNYLSFYVLCVAGPVQETSITQGLTVGLRTDITGPGKCGGSFLEYNTMH